MILGRSPHFVVAAALRRVLGRIVLAVAPLPALALGPAAPARVALPCPPGPVAPLSGARPLPRRRPAARGRWSLRLC